MERQVIWEAPMWEMRMLSPTKRAGKDPCKGCSLKDLCDYDECGRKNFKLFI